MPLIHEINIYSIVHLENLNLDRPTLSSTRETKTIINKTFTDKPTSKVANIAKQTIRK